MMDCTAIAPEMSVFSLMFFLLLPVQVHMQTNPIFHAELPHSITALSGSCVQIPCTFDAPAIKLQYTEIIFGCWIKNHHAFLNPDSLVVLNGNDYYFRVEMNPVDWKYTYVKNPIYISVSDVPELPILTPTDLQEVKEETTVNLSCSAEAPCPKQPPTISWSNISESAHIKAQLQEKPDKTQSVFSYVTFKASYKDHKKNITCTATYPRNTPDASTVKSTVILRVLFSPKETHITIDPSDSVSAGTNVTLTCKSKASPNEMNYTWYKRGQKKELDFGEQLTFNVNRRSGGWYFCSAKNIHGMQISEGILLIVAVSPKETHITIDRSDSVSAGTNVTLTCRSKASPSNNLNYTWYKRGKEMPIAQEKKINFILNYSNTGLYFCRAQNKHGNQSSAEIQLTAEGQDGHSMTVIAGCVGGIAAVLMLSAIGFCTSRTRKKTHRETMLEKKIA
ncbi:hypothetical protein G5714_023572 [Onychostoma macrolepis]|uniref:Ig-like domain-containing protein n=1 Tax=Onychostoma macrolepis TaxID=369639 RepID=A0A7J6BLL4_9TELE|nr:hypothetical protein G5714_023572 [Onychostoma macrolepis]